MSNDVCHFNIDELNYRQRSPRVENNERIARGIEDSSICSVHLKIGNPSSKTEQPRSNSDIVIRSASGPLGTQK